jgi:hypothetical protein
MPTIVKALDMGNLTWERGANEAAEEGDMMFRNSLV